MPFEGHSPPPVLRWCVSSTLVPLQEETSGSAPQNDIGSETQAYIH